VDPEQLHRQAIEKTVSRTVASGRKIVDLQTVRPTVPSFVTVPGMCFVNKLVVLI
jgi:hypothetical protein